MLPVPQSEEHRGDTAKGSEIERLENLQTSDVFVPQVDAPSDEMAVPDPPVNRVPHPMLHRIDPRRWAVVL